MINLTTLSAPKTPFFSASVGMSGDTETTRNLGYDYYGGEHDWTGYDSGLRDTAACARGRSSPAASP